MLRRSTTKGERLGEAGCYPGYFFQRNEGGAESRGQHGGRCDISFATTICRIVGGLRSRPASITERCSSRTGRTAGARPVYASSPPDFPRSESEVIRIPGYPSAAALLPAGARIDYLESSAHYQTVARRALAALRSGRGSFVLLIGDPPADPRALTEALAKMAGFGCTVIDIDGLPDRQIADLCEGVLREDQIQREAVLLAHLDFPARLEQPALRFLKERIAAQFRFEEIDDEEVIAVLHDQLLAQRNRKAEGRGFRHGVMIGLAAGGVAIAGSIGVFLLYPRAEQVCEAPASNAENGAIRKELPMLRPAAEAPTTGAPEPAALNAEMSSAIAAAPALSASSASPIKAEDPHPAPEPTAAPAPGGPRLAAAEIGALLARGDAFFRAGDITSARPFYARAADAGSGQAALQLGATFDPGFRTRLGLSGATADTGQALMWYRRARELGAPEAEPRINALAAQPPKPIAAVVTSKPGSAR